MTKQKKTKAKFEVIARPIGRPTRGQPMSPLTRAVMETVDSGKAVRIPLIGRSANSVQTGLRMTLRRHGYRLKYFTEGRAIIAWAEPLKEHK